MAMDGAGNVIEQALELASKWRIVEAFDLINNPEVDQTGDVEMCRLLFKSYNAMHAGRYETGTRETLLAVKQLERSGYRYLLDWVYSEIGVSFGILGSPEVGLDWVTKAITGAEDRSDEGQIRRSLSDKARLLVMIDEYDQAIALWEKALNLRDVPISIAEETNLLNDLAEIHLRFARREDQDGSTPKQHAEKGSELARSALKLIEAASDDQAMAKSLLNLGSALDLMGKFVEAEDAFKKAASLAGTFPSIQVELLVNYAWMLCDMARFAEAETMLVRAYDWAQSSNQENLMDRIFEARVRLATLAGKSSEVLIWSERQAKFLENRYRQRLAVIARNAEIFIDVERIRLSERRNKIQTGALAAIQASGSQSKVEQSEPLNDSLTSCLNRRGFAIHSEAMFVPGGRAALAIVDADNFKSINDRYGHEVGDKVLKAIGKIFNDSLRNSDLVAHYDGEEFVVLLHGIGSEIAWGICERLRLAIEHHGWGTINAGLHVTVSIGVAAREHDEVLETLTSVASTAVARAKSEGHNRVIAGH